MTDRGRAEPIFRRPHPLQAWKKIEETRKRAGDITALRSENEQKYVAKEQFYKQKSPR